MRIPGEATPTLLLLRSHTRQVVEPFLHVRYQPRPWDVHFIKFTLHTRTHATKAGLQGILVRWVPRIWLNWLHGWIAFGTAILCNAFCMAHLCGLIPAFFNVPRGVSRNQAVEHGEPNIGCVYVTLVYNSPKNIPQMIPDSQNL